MKGSLLLYDLKLNCLIFYRSKQLTDYIYTDIYCELSKCIGQTPCSYEHYLVSNKLALSRLKFIHCMPYDRLRCPFGLVPLRELRKILVGCVDVCRQNVVQARCVR